MLHDAGFLTGPVTVFLVGAFVVGIMFLGEAATPMRLLAAALLLAGMVLMKLSS